MMSAAVPLNGGVEGGTFNSFTSDGVGESVGAARQRPAVLVCLPEHATQEACVKHT